MTLREALDKVPDPISRRGRRHPLGAILALSVCAMMSGARSLYAISQWGRDHGADMSRALGFSRELTPSVATLHRVFSRLDDRGVRGTLTFQRAAMTKTLSACRASSLSYCITSSSHKTLRLDIRNADIPVGASSENLANPETGCGNVIPANLHCSHSCYNFLATY